MGYPMIRPSPLLTSELQYIVVAVATAEHPAELVALALPSAPRQASADRREVSRGAQSQQGDNNTDDRFDH